MHFWGLEAVFRKIMAKYHHLRQMSEIGPISEEGSDVLSPQSTKSRSSPPWRSPRDPTERTNRHIRGVEAISGKIMAKYHHLRQMSVSDALGGDVFRATLRRSVYIVLLN